MIFIQQYKIRKEKTELGTNVLFLYIGLLLWWQKTYQCVIYFLMSIVSYLMGGTQYWHLTILQFCKNFQTAVLWSMTLKDPLEIRIHVNIIFTAFDYSFKFFFVLDFNISQAQEEDDTWCYLQLLNMASCDIQILNGILIQKSASVCLRIAFWGTFYSPIL